jgi:hypothetical protein
LWYVLQIVRVGSRSDREVYYSFLALLYCGGALCPGVVRWSPTIGAGVGEPGAEVKHGRSVDLRNPGFHNSKDEADLLHGRFLVVVKRHDQALTFRQVADCPGQTLPHLPIQVAEQRIVIGSTRYEVQILFV